MRESNDKNTEIDKNEHNWPSKIPTKDKIQDIYTLSIIYSLVL